MPKKKEGNKLRAALRLASGIMLVPAIVFLAAALTHPELGTVFFIGEVAIGARVWRAFYLVYALATVGLFASSFLVGKRKTAASPEEKRGNKE